MNLDLLDALDLAIAQLLEMGYNGLVVDKLVEQRTKLINDNLPL